MPEQPSAVLRLITPILSGSILAANLADLSSEVSLLERAGVQMLHFDVMDGCFCPMMTMGPPVIKAVKTSMRKDVHLMITDPLEKVGDYVAAGADVLTVHVESSRHIHRVLQALAGATNANDPSRGLLRGIALNPGTPVEAIGPLLDEVDLVLLLSVNPDWSGQSFLPSTMDRIRRAKQMLVSAQRGILLGVDGGITRDNIAQVASTGVDLVVAGSAIFDGKTPEQNATYMLGAMKAAVSNQRSALSKQTDC
jgi:ribulose-phosphate 3-epimerase